MNPFDSNVDSMILRCVMSAFVRFNLGDDLTLYTETDEIGMDFTSIESYFKTRLDMDKLNMRIGFLKPIALMAINGLLNDGIPIPVPDNIRQKIKQP